jgi:hypothetical protein
LILFVGSGYERKGLPTLLQALAAMERRDARLWVVGRDKQETLMRKLAQTLGIDQRVMFLGGQSDVRPFYGAADVFALPTLYDPFPNAALEAMASGLPLAYHPDLRCGGTGHRGQRPGGCRRRCGRPGGRSRLAVRSRAADARCRARQRRPPRA